MIDRFVAYIWAQHAACFPNCQAKHGLEKMFPQLSRKMPAGCLSLILLCSAVKQRAGRERGPWKSSRNFVSENGRFRVQVSLWLLWKEQSTLCFTADVFPAPAQRGRMWGLILPNNHKGRQQTGLMASKSAPPSRKSLAGMHRCCTWQPQFTLQGATGSGSGLEPFKAILNSCWAELES